MKRFIQILVSSFLLAGGYAFSQQTVISGYLNPDSTWVRKVYVSHIPDFNQMYVASDQLIIAGADIDSTGYFKVVFPSAAKQSLYRLHCIKKGDPVSTLIIGGREENHVFFSGGISTIVELVKPEAGTFLGQQGIRGGKENDELNSLLYALKNDSIPRDSLKNVLITMADTCTSSLVGLLAVYSSFGLSENQKAKISSILKRYDKSDPYGKRIYEEYKPGGKGIPVILIYLGLLLAAGYPVYRIFRKRKIARIRNLLSQRESGIVQLMLEGKTNKEIAGIFNIELSTVKTHVNNVYAKLKVSDRKELQKYESVFRNK